MSERVVVSMRARVVHYVSARAHRRVRASTKYRLWYRVTQVVHGDAMHHVGFPVLDTLTAEGRLRG
jgi:hypothetical protein